MKDNLFEMLLNLFETSLTQIQKSHKSVDHKATENVIDDGSLIKDNEFLHVQDQHDKSTRIFTYDEQMKLTKASYQFLMRMQLWNILDPQFFEIIMNQLQFSASRLIGLQETKWTIRNVLSSHLHEEQLAFLDLVLYQAEDELIQH
jgi:uncharacterized protein Smg (DUF494 family)